MGLAEPCGCLRHRRDAGDHRLYARAKDVLQRAHGRSVERVTIAGRGATFEGKVVAITGAAGGVGQSLCRYFIDEGAKIAAIDKKDTVEGLLSELKANPKMFASAIADITEPTEVERAFASLTGALGPIDILVNNAGGSTHGTLARPDAAGR